MARYLIRLGRETGEGRHWNRALAMLDADPRPPRPAGPGAARPAPSPTTTRAEPSGPRPGRLGPARDADRDMLDLAGLDYDEAAGG